MKYVAALFEVLSFCACIYYLLCLWGARSFLQLRAERNTSFLPPISILKPLKGTDPEMYESLRSHCVQEYPDYEIVFGVKEIDDPAVAFVERLQNDHPKRSIHLVVCPLTLGGNLKVSSLVQMTQHARHAYWIVNDSDIRVEPDYLRKVIAPLHDPRVGLVTCLYRGIAGGTLASKLEVLGITTDFCGGALAAIQLERGIQFGLGSTLAFRQADLASVGGFSALVDYLADDYQIAQRMLGRGLQVQLSDVIVDTFLPAYTMRSFWSHQLRWARNVLDLRGLGYLGSGTTFGLPWAVFGVLANSASGWAWIILSLVIALRFFTAWFLAAKIVKDRAALRSLYLLPLRDLLGLLIWIGGFVGKTVEWRGNRFRLQNGKLTKIDCE